MKSQIFFSLIFITLLCSCNQDVGSSDYTQPGVFTAGIEGPATDANGTIYAVNFQKEGTIGSVTSSGKASLFLELPDKSIGNGIRFGNDQKMYIADYTGHNILRVDMTTKRIEIYAHQPLANQPNDLTISPNGVIYASDPNWSDNTGNIWKVTKEKGFELLEGNMGTTNGIEVSMDGKKLYVNESVQRKIWVYDIEENGFVKNKKLFFSFEDYGLDGMRFDDKGNLFVCRYGKGSVVALTKEGEILKEFMIKGQKPTNITFSSDYKKFYVTVADRGCIEVVNNIF